MDLLLTNHFWASFFFFLGLGIMSFSSMQKLLSGHWVKHAQGDQAIPSRWKDLEESKPWTRKIGFWMIIGLLAFLMGLYFYSL